jgi:hypothetical protein
MKVYAAILALLFAGLYPAIAADPPAVVVRFGDLSKFSDLRMSILRTERDSASLADELARHLEHAATPRLPRARASPSRSPMSTWRGSTRRFPEASPTTCA